MGTKPIQIIQALYQLIQAIGMTVLHPLSTMHINTRVNMHAWKPYVYWLPSMLF